MNIIKKSLQSLLLVPILALGVSAIAPVADTVSAACDDSITITNGANCARGTGQQESIDGEGGAFTLITNILLYIIGAVSVIMLVIGGIRYTVSGGDSAAVTSAKNTILYAVVGIVVALLAYALVNFVLKGFGASA